MRNSGLIAVFDWLARGGLFLVPFLVLIVASSMFFPYITGKGFFFRILIEILFGFWLGLLILDPARYLPRKNILLYAVVIFVFALFLADVFGVNPYKSFWSNYERMEGLNLHLHLLAYFLMMISVFRTSRDWFIFFHISIFVSLIVAGYGYFEKFGWIQGSSDSRVFSTIGNPIYLASYLLIHYFILGFYYFQAERRRLKVIYAAIFLFELPIFFFTETRGALLGFLAGIGLILFLKFFETKNQKIKFGLAASLIIVFLIPFLLIFFQERNFIKSRPLLNRFASISIFEPTVQARFMIWKMALKSWTERPVFGWGQDNFIGAFARNYNPRLYGNEPWFDRTHNTPLQWLVEAGIVGFLAYLFVLFSAGWLLRKIYREKILSNNQVVLASGFFAAYFVQGFFVFDSLATYFLIVGLLGFLYFYTAKERVQEIKSYLPESFKYALVFGAIGLSFFLVFYLNSKPLNQAREIIVSLKSIGQKQTPEIITNNFGQTLEINSFGLTETREQLGNFLIQVFSSSNILGQGYFRDLLDRAILEMKKETERDPFNVRPLIFYGKLLAIRAGLTGIGYDESELAYKKAIELGPNYVQSHLALAELYLLKNDPEKIREVGKKIFEFSFVSPQLYDPLITFYVLAGEYKNSWKIINQSARFGIWPSASEFLKWGRQILKQGNLKEAEKFLEASLRESSRINDKEAQIKSLLFLAETEARLSKKDKAIFYAKEAEKLKPELKPEVDKFIESVNSLL